MPPAALLCFLLLAILSPCVFPSPPLLIPTITGDDFWPLCNTRHHSFSHRSRSPSPALQTRTEDGERQRGAQGHPTRLSKNSSHPPSLHSWLLGISCTGGLHPGRAAKQHRHRPLSSIPAPQPPLDFLPIQHLRLELSVTTSLT